MARRADHTREELTELAVSAGLELIKKQGFSKFSARSVATNIGYTIGTIYHVFGNYDNFILHINARTLDVWFDAMVKAIEADKGKNPVRALAQAYIAFSQSHYHQWMALFDFNMSPEHEVPEWYLAKMTRFFALVEKPLMPLVGGNRRKAKRSARILWAGIHGVCVLSLSGKLDLVEADSVEILAMSFIENYTSGLKQSAA